VSALAAIASVLGEWLPRHVLPQFLSLRLLLPVIYAAISKEVFDVFARRDQRED
jgi:hypothetical protein